MEEKPGEKITDYVRSAPMRTEQMQAEIQGYLNSMENVALFEVTSTILKANEEKFYTYPAATETIITLWVD